MAKYGGFFLKGLAGGLQTGLNMGLQIQEMKWQKEQRKKLEEKQRKIEESVANIGNLFKQYGADNAYSDIEIMQLNTAILASVPEVQAVFKGAVNNIQTMNKSKLEEDLQWLDLFIDWTEGLDPKDVQGIFDTVKGRIQTEKGKNLLTAYENIHKKRYEAAQARPEDVWGKAAILPQEVRPEFLRAKGVEIPEVEKAPGITDYNSAWNHLMHWKDVSPEAYDKKHTNFQKQFPNIDMSDITQEALRSGEVAPKERAISLPLQEKWKQKVLDANTWEDAQEIIKTYAGADYDIAEMPVKQDWINAKLEELDSHVEMLKEITDENGRLMGSKSFKFLSGDKEETQTGEEWYKDIYEAYIFYLEELRKMEIDVSKYTKIRPPEETKVGFLKGFVTPGLGRGYQSIYY